jgi:hypothetical protein
MSIVAAPTLRIALVHVRKAGALTARRNLGAIAAVLALRCRRACTAGSALSASTDSKEDASSKEAK